MARTPARWPKRAGCPRRRAQRPLPSMMMPMCLGTGFSKVLKRVPARPEAGVAGSDSARLVPEGRNNSVGLARLVPAGRIPGLDLEDLVFLAVRKRVHALDLAVDQLLEPGVRALRVVLRHLTGLDHGVDAVQLVAPHVADRHACLLRLLAHEAHVLLASLLGERRDRDPDHLSVVGGVEAHVPRAQRLLDRSDLALVVDLHHQQPRLRSADLSQLVEWSGRAVIGHDDAVDQRGVGAAGADRRELAREVIHGLRHLLIGVTDDGIDHVAAPTRVPICSPSTTRSMLPGISRLNTTIGTPLSMHSVSAVLSMTSMPRFKTSR